MRVLVTAASRHGATMAIADAIGAELRAAGVDATVASADHVDGVDDFDAVVIGSGVYAGHWLEPAKRLIERNTASLSARPVWLFSSGPLGEPLKPAEDPVDVGSLAARVGARDHRVFAGRIERSSLGLGERAIVRVVGAPEGDFRPWEDIRAWSGEIAAALGAPAQ